MFQIFIFIFVRILINIAKKNHFFLLLNTVFKRIFLQGLQPGTDYTIRVLAHNQLGPGESSPPLMVSTQPEVDLPGPPLHVSASPVSAFSILVSWDPPLGMHRINKYRLYYRRVSFIILNSRYFLPLNVGALGEPTIIIFL